MKATLVKKGLDDCKFCSSNGKSTQRRFEKHRFAQGSTISLSPKAGHLLFILEGEIKVEDEESSYTCGVNQMVLIGYNNKYRITSLAKGRMMILNFTTHYHVCVNISAERIWNTIKTLKYKFNTLEMVPPMQQFVESVMFYLDNKINCDYLHKSKAVEISTIFRFFYTAEETANFFYPVLYKDLSFDTLVRKNYKQAKTIQELADLCGYSLSKFKQTFTKHFGISPYQWMQQQKISKLKADLANKTIPFKTITFEHGFVDQSHLNAFCKRYLNATPSQIRNNKTED